VISPTDSKQRRPGFDASYAHKVSTWHAAARRPLLALLLALSLLVGVLAITVPSAFAEDGLPPGVPVPAWAVGKYVHFTLPKSSTPAGGFSPLVAGGPGQTLHYFGGPVQHEPQLFVIFWGAGFEEGPPATEELTQLRDFYLGLEENKGEPGEKSWQGIISQYYDNEGPGSRRVKVAVIWDDPNSPGELTNSKVEGTISELVSDEKAKGVNPSPEAQYIVLPQPGTSYKDYPQMNEACGFHAIDGEGYSYSLIAWAGDVGCESSVGNLAETNGTAAHEFAESATDPEIEEPGKNYSQRVAWQQEGTGEEVADLCEKYPAEKPANDAWYAVKLWDDEGGNKCNLEDPPYEPPPVPTATTEGISGLQYRQVNVAGSVNPNGPDTHYEFQYGTTTGYGSSIPLPAADIGYGTSNVSEGVTITGLKPGTTYHYRIVGTSWVGSGYGVDKGFTTPIPPPAVKTEAPTEVGETHAVLNAQVDPEEFSTTYQIEYWQNGKSSEIKKIPATAESVGSGTSYVKVSQHLTGLPKSTEYIYRVTATNAGGTTKGKEVTFVTGPFLEWKSSPNPSGATESVLNGVSCLSGSSCVGVGYYREKTGELSGGALGESWNGAEWQLRSIPLPEGGSGLVLEGVSCSSSTACTAVGYYRNSEGFKTLAERWNGTEWKVQSTPNPTGTSGVVALDGVSCSSATSCVAVGFNSTGSLKDSTLIESWNGTEWKIQSSPNPGKEVNALHGVSCTSSTACTAVGTVYSGVLIERWNGTEWLSQTGVSKGATSGLNAVSCTSATACAAVGSYETSSLAESWNGTTWTSQSVPSPSGAKETGLRGVSCSSSTFCIATGSYENSSGIQETLGQGWNGAEWKLQLTSIPAGANTGVFVGVSCISAAMCTTTGHYEGSSGTIASLVETTGVPIAATEAATGVSSSGATLNGTVIPDGWGTTYHFEYGPTNSYGTKVPVPDAGLASETIAEKVSKTITGLTEGTTYHYRIVATSVEGTIDGEDHTFTTPRAAWSVVSTPNPSGATENALNGVSCVSATTCVGVGDDKNSSRVFVPLGEAWNGTEWQLKSMPVPSGSVEVTLEGVSCSSSTACTAVGSYQTSTGPYKTLAERWNGSEWTIQSTPTPTGESYFVGLDGVSCSSATSCIAVGFVEVGVFKDTTLIESWNGTEWKIQTSPNPSKEVNALHGVSCTSSTACTAVGTIYSGVLIERWNGTEWVFQTGANGGSGSGLNAVSCTSATACTAVGGSGTSGLAESWNGTAWTSQNIPSPSGAKETTLLGTACPSTASCVATGWYINSSGAKVALGEGWNGTEWQIVSTPNPTGATSSELSGVSCASSAECTAVGHYLNSSGTNVTLAESGP
jgi:hypothetical protein